MVHKYSLLTALSGTQSYLKNISYEKLKKMQYNTQIVYPLFPSNPVCPIKYYQLRGKCNFPLLVCGFLCRVGLGEGEFESKSVGKSQHCKGILGISLFETIATTAWFSPFWSDFLFVFYFVYTAPFISEGSATCLWF